MANPKPSKELQEQQAIVNELKQQLQLYDELQTKKKQLSEYDIRGKSNLNAQLNQWTALNGNVDKFRKQLQEAQGEYAKLSKEATKAAKSLESQSKAAENLKEDFSELDTFQRSITRRYGEQSDETRRINKNVDAIKVTVGGIGRFLKKNVNLEEDQRDALVEASEYLKSMPSSFDKLNRQISRGTINQKKYNQYAADLNDNWEEILDKINESDSALKGIKKSLKSAAIGQGLSGQAQLNYEKIIKEEYKNKERGAITSTLLEPIPGGEGINKLVEARHYEKEKPGSSSAKLARSLGYMALGAGLADFASQMRAYIPILSKVLNYVQNTYAPQLAAAQGDVNIAQAKFNRNAQLFGGPLSKKYGKGFFYAAEATKDFEFQMRDLNNEFNKASKTAFFGRGIGSVAYNTSKMQLAGVGADAVASAISDIASASNVNFFGSKEGLGSQAAVFARQMGIGTQSIGQIVAAFRRASGFSGKTALNMVYTSAEMADIAKLNPSVILQDMAEASGKMLSYNIKNAKAFAQQAIALRQMGGNLPQFAQGITGSILNYRESLQAQISLSNMLNRPVDFSVAQSLAYQGKYAEAYQNIKQSGVLDAVKKAGIIPQAEFAKIFGMGLDDFQAAAENQGKGLGLKGTLKGETGSFLDRFSGAEQAFQIKAAQIRFDKAIIDEEFAKVLAVGLNSNPEYLRAVNRLNDLTLAANKLQSLMNGLFLALGSALGLAIPKLLPKSPTPTPTGGVKPTTGGVPAGGNFAGYKMTGTGPNAMLQRPNGQFASAAERAAFDKATKMAKYAKVGRVAGRTLGVLGAGLDAYGRVQEGQTATQTIAGVGAGLTGAYAGAQLGASIGAFGGPLAPLTVPVGGLIGGGIGYFVGGKAADMVTGVGKPKVTPTPQTQQVQTALDESSQMLNVMKNIELLVADIAGYQATPTTVQMIMDGKDISNSLIRHQKNTQGQVKQTTLRQSLGWYK